MTVNVNFRRQYLPPEISRCSDELSLGLGGWKPHILPSNRSNRVNQEEWLLPFLPFCKLPTLVKRSRTMNGLEMEMQILVKIFRSRNRNGSFHFDSRTEFPSLCSSHFLSFSRHRDRKNERASGRQFRSLCVLFGNACYEG